MLKNCKIINFEEHSDSRGSLIAIENSKNLPFDIQRIYYIYNVSMGEERGFHSHRNLEQVLICVNGSVKIRISTHDKEEVVVLDNPNKGLYIGPMVWREMFDFEDNAVLLVLASHKYDPSDYIKDKQVFIKEARDYYEG